MATKVLIATEKPFAPIAVKGIREIVEKAGFELKLLEKYTTKEELINAVADADAMIVRSDKVTADVIKAAKNMKIVVRAGAGYDNLDLAACTAHKVVAMNTPGQNSNAVAELEFGMLLYMFRNSFDGSSGSELKDKKFGIAAYGNIGRNVARIAKGFGMDVYAFSRSSEAVAKKDGVKTVGSLEELFKTCDIVSVHYPSNDKTKKCINYDLVKLMPKGGVLVNTARKEIIDEEGLLKAMQEREDLKYATDIMPVKAEEFAPLKGRYFSTPKKMGAQTKEANINAGLAAANQIVDYIKNGNETFKVN